MSTPNPKTRITSTRSATPAKKPAPAAVKPQTVQAKKPSRTPGSPQTTTKQASLKTATKPSKPAAGAISSPAKTPTIKAPTQPSKPTPPKSPVPQEPKADNWLNRTVQGGVAYMGNYAGGLVNGVGDGVNKVGESIGNRISSTTRQWGQGVAGYGNDIKDSVGVGGPRMPTAGNPLGIAGVGAGKQASSGRKAQTTASKNAGNGSGANPLGLA